MNFYILFLDSEGKTPLMLCAEHGDFHILSLLLEKGANLELKDIYGCDVFNAAMNGPNPRCLQKLIVICLVLFGSFDNFLQQVCSFQLYLKGIFINFDKEIRSNFDNAILTFERSTNENYWKTFYIFRNTYRRIPMGDGGSR